MVAHVQAFDAVNPHIRQIDPWRDGRAVANLLETAFREDAIDESGLRMLNQLRNYGVFEALSFGFGTGFVWVEDGEVVANASVQRNFTRRDAWMIGNVATRADMRNHGIGRSVIDACIQYAAGKGARYVALQADARNQPALHLYAKAGFEQMGEVTHYTRANARQATKYMGDGIRHARWSDRAAVWALARANVPEALTFAESFDSHVYQLGVWWSLSNTFNGNAEQWLVLPEQAGATQVKGALRTRANLDGNAHHLEVVLSETASADDGLMLIARGLERLEQYVRKPVYAAQSQPHAASHAALQTAGFQAARTLVHMRLEISNW